MKIAILTTNQVDDDNRLVEVARAKGHDAFLLDLRQFSIELLPNNPEIYYQNEVITNQFDIVIPRLNVSYTDFGINILQQFICAGIYVSESPEALRLGRDKLKCLQYLLSKGLPFPATAIAYTPEYLETLVGHLKLPIVVKLIESTEGTGVFLAKTKKEVDNLCKTFSLAGVSYQIQEFIAEAAGQDVRAFVVGDRVVAAMQRESQDDDFRANVSLGAHSAAVGLTQEEEEVVLRATQSIGVNIAGVDFVRSSRGPLLLEINVSPDFTGKQGLETVTDCNIAAAIIDYTLREAKGFYREQTLTVALSRQEEELLCADG
ncbi:RimK family alpha-L-glutamate ligase [Shewanella insulae]|uniref:RimK family alpha-L-glutamate ligase n=1 Tax=Shewanella insulae TaxID=2681496 RepID=A0A6L7I013_9GAMM|nr:RimK family alpha-L-glutamate ligase [Shewanella insulae]MCG9714784.1 RimK family alpha-L-glutamate ligase [Shewanella insulae]MCG9739658.1 RimK family alpha-L-glutamate ligase [Shewanella insulae]MCG9754623.1 RimK family alpha-L-glutamate ligase [Shewanella insulae]MXR69905.1 RimK family alpha-L-glutamate ligase [Shewanella insulae]